MKKIIKNTLHSRMVMSLAGIAVIVSIAFVKNPSNEKQSTVFKNKVSQPLKNVDIDYENYIVDAAKSTILKYKSGSKIIIPDNAFLDKSGKAVVGEVNIKYREFHNPSDFFVSGIPMTYDSAGVQYQFESAGMLEIAASQNNKPVFANPAKKIIVEMASMQVDDKYNIYKFDSASGNWKYVYKDKVIAGPVINDKQNDEKALSASGNNKRKNKKNETNELPVSFNMPARKIETTADSNSIAPKKSNMKNFHFDVETDSAEFPEIASYKGCRFEVCPKEKDFDPIYASVTWNDIKLEKGRQKGSYLMTLSKEFESHTFETVPVFEGKNYDEALTQYNKLYSSRKEKEAKEQRVSDSIYRLLNRERMDRNAFALNFSQQQTASNETQNMVQRVFVISGFGIWNSDCPASLPKGAEFAATYTDTLGKELIFKTLYLVEKGRNAMFSIASYSRLYYNPKKKNILWAVTSDNKLAVFDEKDFKKIKIKNDKCNIKMTVIEKPITKSYEVRSILNI